MSRFNILESHCHLLFTRVALQVFGPDVLPILIPALRAFSPPYTPSSTDFQGLSIYPSLILTDFEALEESCTLIESLSLDVEDVRLSLARGLSFPAEHGGVPCLSAMLDFIECGSYSPLWYVDDEVPQSERKRREKAFDICKAAVIKAVVEVSGEERNEEVLWDDSVVGKPGGEFVSRMVDWIKRYVTDKENAGNEVDRDDLVICATLSLGNLSRRGRFPICFSRDSSNFNYLSYRIARHNITYAATFAGSSARVRSSTVSLDRYQNKAWGHCSFETPSPIINPHVCRPVCPHRRWCSSTSYNKWSMGRKNGCNGGSCPGWRHRRREAPVQCKW